MQRVWQICLFHYSEKTTKKVNTMRFFTTHLKGASSGFYGQCKKEIDLVVKYGKQVQSIIRSVYHTFSKCLYRYSKNLLRKEKTLGMNNSCSNIVRYKTFVELSLGCRKNSKVHHCTNYNGCLLKVTGWQWNIVWYSTARK